MDGASLTIFSTSFQYSGWDVNWSQAITAHLFRSVPGLGEIHFRDSNANITNDFHRHVLNRNHVIARRVQPYQQSLIKREIASGKTRPRNDILLLMRAAYYSECNQLLRHFHADWCLWASLVPAPMCGEPITLSSLSSFQSVGGSSSKTSNAAPATLPLVKAS